MALLVFRRWAMRSWSALTPAKKSVLRGEPWGDAWQACATGTCDDASRERGAAAGGGSPNPGGRERRGSSAPRRPCASTSRNCCRWASRWLSWAFSTSSVGGIGGVSVGTGAAGSTRHAEAMRRRSSSTVYCCLCAESAGAFLLQENASLDRIGNAARRRCLHSSAVPATSRDTSGASHAETNPKL